MDLKITETATDSGARTLVLTGSVDIASKQVLTEAGRIALLEHGAHRLTLDLAEVSFIDSSGLGALIELAGLAADRGSSFALRAPSRRVQRVLDLTGLTDAWDVLTD
jgi:anti-sigma B factor antagonist